MRKIMDGWPRKRNRHAFTLVEMTLVVGIIGMVVSGIWAAGSMASYNAKANQASDELNMILANTRSYYASQNTSFVALNAIHALETVPSAATFCYYSGRFLAAGAGIATAAGIYPQGMLDSSSGTTVANHPFSQVTDCTGAVGSAELALACTPNGAACDPTKPVQIVIRFTNILLNDTCVDLLVHNSTAGTGIGLSKIMVNGVAVPGGLPVSAATAIGVCGVAPYAIDWYYNVGG